jgi:hypothetical protein
MKLGFFKTPPPPHPLFVSFSYQPHSYSIQLHDNRKLFKLLGFGWCYVFVMQDKLVREGKGLVAVLYTYRSCVKALPQVHFLITKKILMQ